LSVFFSWAGLLPHLTDNHLNKDYAELELFPLSVSLLDHFHCIELISNT